MHTCTSVNQFKYRAKRKMMKKILFFPLILLGFSVKELIQLSFTVDS